MYVPRLFTQIVSTSTQPCGGFIYFHNRHGSLNVFVTGQCQCLLSTNNTNARDILGERLFALLRRGNVVSTVQSFHYQSVCRSLSLSFLFFSLSLPPATSSPTPPTRHGCTTSARRENGTHDDLGNLMTRVVVLLVLLVLLCK